MDLVTTSIVIDVFRRSVDEHATGCSGRALKSPQLCFWLGRTSCRTSSNAMTRSFPCHGTGIIQMVSIWITSDLKGGSSFAPLVQPQALSSFLTCLLRQMLRCTSRPALTGRMKRCGATPRHVASLRSGSVGSEALNWYT